MNKKFIACDAAFDDAKIVLFGVPYDATATYRKGSAKAPAAIRAESVGIETYSPYIDRDLEDIAVHDAGDIKITSKDQAPMVYGTEAKVSEILEHGKFPVMLGGEHLVTLGAFRAIHKKYPDVCIIHFDAHTDLREDWEGDKLNHSTVIKRCWEVCHRCEVCHPERSGAESKDLGFAASLDPSAPSSLRSESAQDDKRIFQFGIRSGERAEFEWAKTNTHLCKHNFETLAAAIKQIGNRPVYFTIDLDILDPSEFGGTGTPEAGGVTFLELLAATQKVFRSLNVVGCDINELCPPCDQNGASTALACKFLREVLLLIK